MKAYTFLNFSLHQQPPKKYGNCFIINLSTHKIIICNQLIITSCLYFPSLLLYFHPLLILYRFSWKLNCLESCMREKREMMTTLKLCKEMFKGNRISKLYGCVYLDVVGRIVTASETQSKKEGKKSFFLNFFHYVTGKISVYMEKFFDNP